MIYVPHGHCPDDSIVDPQLILQEWYEAMRVLTRSTQWQWEVDSILDQDKIEKGESVTIDQMATWADYSVTTLTTPDLTHSGSWDVPYNTNYDVVPMPDEVDADKQAGLLKWTSKYPELVFVWASYQYTRAEIGVGLPDGIHIRTKIRIAIDDILQMGSGPYAIPIDTKHRGAGVATRAIRTTAVAARMVEAGTHVVSLQACQEQCQDSSSDDYAEEDKPKNSQPVSDVVTIGNRRVIVMRLAQARWMTT